MFLYPQYAEYISNVLTALVVYVVFHKKQTFSFSHNSVEWWSIYMTFLLVVAEEILIWSI